MFKYFKNFNHLNIFKRTFNINSLKTQQELYFFYPYAKFAFYITQEEREDFQEKYKEYMAAKKPKKRTGKTIKITKKKEIVQSVEMSDEMKEELDKQVNYITDLTEEDSSKKLERMSALNYMQNMDSSFEGFFFKREFSLNNFNYYLQVLSRQSKKEHFEIALEKMESLGIQPNLTTFTHMLTGYARAKDIKKCEEIFEYVKRRGWTPNRYFYTSLLLAYAKNCKVHEADAILKEMKDEGIEPDRVTYTTMILAYKRAGIYKKCWDLYYEALGSGEADEILMSYMIRVCAATHDSEKALNIYQAMELKGFLKNTANFNSIIFALSSKKKYALKTFELFEKMKLMGVKPDLYTYVGVLRATSFLGDINTANDVVKEIKLLGYQINEYICNGLIRTYAGASRIKYTKEEHIEAYIKDTWEIYNFMEQEGIPINVQILNALLEVHTANHKLEVVDGLVLPLFEKHRIPMNKYTYQHLFSMLIDLRKFPEIVELYHKMRNNGIEANQKALNILLEAGIRTGSSDSIMEAFEELRRIERFVSPWLLRILTNMKDLPDRIYAELKEHHLPYNLMNKERWKTFTQPMFRKKLRSPPKPMFRKRDRRTRLK
jgi:pentatricopeptide repeat protein